MSVVIKSLLDSGAKWRVRVAEFSLPIATIVIVCIAGELAFAFVGLQFVPLGLQRYLPADVRLFAQVARIPARPSAHHASHGRLYSIDAVELPAVIAARVCSNQCRK